jgi:hypothetical protein
MIISNVMKKFPDKRSEHARNLHPTQLPQLHHPQGNSRHIITGLQRRKTTASKHRRNPPYYSRAVDPSIATAVHYLGSIQSWPTTNDMAKTDRMIQYLSSNPNNGIRFYASNMVYQLMSDASYLSSPRARSVGGWFGYLGEAHTINGPVAYGTPAR